MSALKKLRDAKAVKDVQDSIRSKLKLPENAIGFAQMYRRKAEFQVNIHSRYDTKDLIEAAHPASVRQEEQRGQDGKIVQETWIEVHLPDDDKLHRVCAWLPWIALLLLVLGFAGLAQTAPQSSSAPPASVFSRFSKSG